MIAKFKITKEIKEYHKLSDDSLKAVKQFKNNWNEMHKIQIIKIIKIEENPLQFKATIK